MSFREYDSMEAAFADMRAMEERANAGLTDEQRTIDYGSHWASGFEDILIFGYVHTLKELDDKEAELGASKRERRDEEAMIVDAHGRGYRFGTAYSIIEPTGELGSTHVSRMTPITKEEFSQAEGHGWTVADMWLCPECHGWTLRILRKLGGWQP